jgi:hypothetical protein
VQVGLGYPFEVLDPALAPPVDRWRRQPAEADQHVDGRHVPSFGQGRFGCLGDSPLELRLIVVRHRANAVQDHLAPSIPTTSVNMARSLRRRRLASYQGI